MGGEVTLPDGSHPICLGLRLFPGSNAAVHQVIVATRDGTLDAIFAFLHRGSAALRQLPLAPYLPQGFRGFVAQ